MTSTTPDRGVVAALFERVPGGFFAPLAGPSHALYWRLLEQLYVLEFEREPLYVSRAAATDYAALIAAAAGALVVDVDVDSDSLLSKNANDEANDGDDDGRPERALGLRMLRRLERAGWFVWEYRAGVGEVLAFSPPAARVLEALVRVARDEQPIFQGYAHSIATLLQRESFAARPGVVLVEARRHTLELVRELKILDRNIALFVQRILNDASDAAAVLDQSFEAYRKAVMGNYHRLKTVDNLFKWRAGVLLRLDEIERETLLLESAARWMKEELHLDDDAARLRVRDDLALLRAEFEKLPALIDSIDLRNARFSGSALRKLQYLLRHNRRIEGQLQLAIEHVGDDDAPAIDVDVYRCELLGDGFFYQPPKRREQATAQRVVRASDADKAAVRARVAATIVDVRSSRPRIEALVKHALHGRPEGELAELPLDDDQGYVDVIFAAAFGLDGRSPYRLEPRGQERVRKGRYAIPRARIIGRRR